MSTAAPPRPAGASTNGYRLDPSLLGTVPTDLVVLPQWVLWKYVTKSKTGKPTKIPFRADTGEAAASDDPSTWTTYFAALDAYRRGRGRWSGIGVMFAPKGGLVGVDLDNSLDDAGEMLPWAQDIFHEIGGDRTFGEVSPSATGIKLFLYDELPGDGTGKNVKGFGPDKTGGVEMYGFGRFFTITGNRFHLCTDRIARADKGLEGLYTRLCRMKGEGKKPGNLEPFLDNGRPKHQRTTTTTSDDGDKLERCWAYLQKCPEAISGSGGHKATYRAACETIRFDLSASDAAEVMRRWNAEKCDEKWTPKEIDHKLNQAAKNVGAADRGFRLRERPNYREDDATATSDPTGQAEDAAQTPPEGEGESGGGSSSSTSYDPFGGSPIPLKPPPTPLLPTGIFEGWGEEMIFATAESTETPPVLAGGLYLSALGTACQGRFVVNPSKDHFEELCFWTASGLQSGARKTPVLKKIVGPIFGWQQRKAAEYEPIIRRAVATDEIERTRIKLIRKRAAETDDAAERALLKQQAQDMEDGLPPIPISPRLTTEDCTPEHFATLLKLHQERMSIFSDEGGPVDLWAGRYSNGIPNIELYLKGYSGSTFMQDRGNRPATHLSRPTISIGIAPQPEVVAAMVNNEIFRKRGLVARFLVFLPDSRIGYRTLKTTPVPDEVAAEYDRRLTDMIELEAAPNGEGGYQPRILSLSGEAWHIWTDFAHQIEASMRPDGELERLQDWGCKLAGSTARIAGLFHVAKHGRQAIRFDEIAGDTMTRAVKMARFSIPHMLAVFEGMDKDGRFEAARRLWRVCVKNRDKRADPNIVTAREMWHPLRGTYKTTEAVEPAIRTLIDHNWIVELPSSEHRRPGSPSRRFRINPKAWEASEGESSGHCGHRSQE